MRFQDKNILITGGGTGVGAEVAQRVASEGARVAVLGRRPEPLDLVARDTGSSDVRCRGLETKTGLKKERALLPWLT